MTTPSLILRQQLMDDYLPNISKSTPGKMIYGLDQQRNQLFDLLKRTLTFKESNSVLLVGPRGSGKTMINQTVLRDLIHQFGRNSFSLVELNGLIQTDDRIALREIALQLKIQRDIDAATATSFSATLAFILDTLKQGSKEAVPIVFILDEFDQFASHNKQTLLYNLFDICQSAQTPIAVVGISCRLDVVEMLEKRVKSRFSHRQIHFFHTFAFKDYLSMAQNNLTLPNTAGAENTNTNTKEWNTQVSAMFKEGHLKSSLQHQFDVNKDPRLLNCVLAPVITPQTQKISSSDIVDSINSQFIDAKTLMLQGLSTLELCLMIAMNHVQSKLDHQQPFNFEMVYEEYKKFSLSNVAVVDFFSKPVSLKAFEHLLALELIYPVHANTSNTPKEYRFVKLMVEPTQIVDAVMRFPGCSSAVKRWGTQWVE